MMEHLVSKITIPLVSLLNLCCVCAVPTSLIVIVMKSLLHDTCTLPIPSDAAPFWMLYCPEYTLDHYSELRELTVEAMDLLDTYWTNITLVLWVDTHWTYTTQY